jgi:hypothetical protein
MEPGEPVYNGTSDSESPTSHPQQGGHITGPPGPNKDHRPQGKRGDGRITGKCDNGSVPAPPLKGHNRDSRSEEAKKR